MTLWVAEHGKIFKGSEDRILGGGDLELCGDSFESVLSLLDDVDESPDSVDFESIFRFSRPYGRPQLKIRNYVGLIRTAGDVQIEVLPKLAKNIDPNDARELLVRMLIELEDSPFREAKHAELSAHKMPLFEVLLRHFLRGVADIVRKGIARNYVDEEDNIPFLRGKLLLSEHIRRNAVVGSLFYCEFDEYQGNRPINRLIRSALGVVASTTGDSSNKQLCQELLFWFQEIPLSTDYVHDFKRIQRDRLVSHYMPTMPLCRLILQQLNPLTQRGRNKAISMLFPMERVFEDFVAAKLHRQLTDWRLRTQSRGHALVEMHSNRAMFSLIPDMVLARDGQRVVADTKWKLIDEQARNKNYGISQSDIYQLFAYSKKILATSDRREVYLIYPASDSFTQPLQPFWYEEESEVLYVVPFDLEAGELMLPPGAVLQRSNGLDGTPSVLR